VLRFNPQEMGVICLFSFHHLFCINRHRNEDGIFLGDVASFPCNPSEKQLYIVIMMHDTCASWLIAAAHLVRSVVRGCGPSTGHWATLKSTFVKWSIECY
jgi:hypothetical protein